MILIGALLSLFIGPPPRALPPKAPDWLEMTRLWNCADLNTMVRLRYIGNDRHGTFIVECQ